MQEEKKIEQDVRLATNERARRRRQRQRRNARNRRRRQQSQQRGCTNIRQQYKRNYEQENKQEEKQDNPTAIERIQLNDVISDDLTQFCEAVVHPFGNNAVGAILPDRYQELVVATTDKLEFDLSPALFNQSGTWETDDNVKLLGVYMWFQPRCLSAGLADWYVYHDTANFYNTYRNPFVCIDPEMSTADQTGILNAYNLCYTGIWHTTGTNPPPGGISYGFYNDLYMNNGNIRGDYRAIEYTRFSNTDANLSKLRILGAGIKMWSEEAPINTGGYSVGGWMSLESIMEKVTWDEANNLPVSPGSLYASQAEIRFAKRTPGVKGSTVRYSPLQTSEQLECEYPSIPDRMFNVEAPAYAYYDDATSTGTVEETNNPVISPDNNTNMSTNDLTTPGSYVPVVFWAFNVLPTTSASEKLNGVYTIKVSSVVHCEGQPLGTCPFGSTKSKASPMANHVKTLLENPEQFPVAASGHSFKSFVSKAKHVITKISKGASHFAKFMAVFEKAMAE